MCWGKNLSSKDCGNIPMLKEEMVSSFSRSSASFENSSLWTSFVSLEMFKMTCGLSTRSFPISKRTPTSWSSLKKDVIFLGREILVFSMDESIDRVEQAVTLLKSFTSKPSSTLASVESLKRGESLVSWTILDLFQLFRSWLAAVQGEVVHLNMFRWMEDMFLICYFFSQ